MWVKPTASWFQTLNNLRMIIEPRIIINYTNNIGDGNIWNIKTKQYWETPHKIGFWCFVSIPRAAIDVFADVRRATLFVTWANCMFSWIGLLKICCKHFNGVGVCCKTILIQTCSTYLQEACEIGIRIEFWIFNLILKHWQLANRTWGNTKHFLKT